MDKTVTLRFRCTPEEEAIFDVAAMREALTLSAWLRKIASNAAASPHEHPKPLPVTAPPRLPQDKMCAKCFVRGYASCNRCKQLEESL